MNNKKTFSVLIFAIIIIFLILSYSGFFNFHAPDFRTYTGWLPALIAISALVDSINPCAFSVLFLTLAFLFSLSRTRNKIVLAGLLYILGIFLVYVLIGLGILHVLTLFNAPKIISNVGAAVIILFGLVSLINEFFPNFPIKLKIPKFAYGKIAKIMEKATLPAMFILGVVVGFFEFPCTGGPYLFVLGLLHDQTSYWRGFGYLIFYNFVFVLPLLVALAVASNKKVLDVMDKVRRAETKQARIWIALIMILLGVLIFVIQ
jgi:cytochrome c biogenesis protein CcdA